MPESPFASLATTFFADVLEIGQVMEHYIRPLLPDTVRIAGPAFTVRCAPGDNLMLHAAIYRAAPGSVIVVQAGDARYAVSGGNVCAVAQKRGIAGFVVDGVVRDLEEIQASQFPVFARGISPKPGNKEVYLELNTPVSCGGITVSPGDIVVADEEGIVVVPSGRSAEVLLAARKKYETDEQTTLEQWRSGHQAKIDALLAKSGFTG